MRGGLTGLLFLIFLALVAVVGAEVKLGTVQEVAGRSGGVPGRLPPRDLDLAPFELPPIASLSETVERPLFSETRRPPEPVTLPAAAAPTPVKPVTTTNVGPFVLSAIVIDDRERVALLKDPKTGKLERIPEGQSVAGWKLARIEPGTVTLTRNGEERKVILRRFEPAPAPAPAARARVRSRNVARSNRRAAPRTRTRTPARPNLVKPRASRAKKREEDCGLSRC